MKRTNHNYTELLVLEAFKSTGSLIVNKTLIKFFGLVGATVLSNYIDKHQYFKNKQGTKFDGWFFLKHKDIMQELYLKENAIGTNKRKFIQIGFIEIKKKGIPAKEWFRIDFTILAKCIFYFSNTGLDPEKIRGLDPEKIRGLINNNKDYNNTVEEKSSTSGSTTSKKKSPIEKRNKEFIPLSKILYDTISLKKNIRFNEKTCMKKWSDEIRRLVENNGINPSRIKKALRWYKVNIGGAYVPLIDSGMSLREKFIKLEDAIQREEGEATPKEHRKPKDEKWMT